VTQPAFRPAASFLHSFPTLFFAPPATGAWRRLHRSLRALTPLLYIALACLGAAARADDLRSEQIRTQVIQMPTAVATFYEQRAFAAIWNSPEQLSELIAALEALSGDGLDPEKYHLTQLKERQALVTDARPEVVSQRAMLDILATGAYLRALHDLLHGKVDPAKLDAEWNFTTNDSVPLEAADAVTLAITGGKIAESFAQARPQHPLYGELRTALARLRAIAERGGWPQLPAGPTLKPGVTDPRVPLLRQRLQAAEDLPEDALASDVYDEQLTAAVKQFQREQYLKPDGSIGPSTLAALNVSTRARIDQLRVNLERGRWLLHDVPENFVLVDIAGYKVSYYKNGERLWRSRVQVGKPYRSTPIFKSAVNHITLNPTWTVPPTILRKDILPKVRRDPGYLARNNIRVLDRNGQVLSANQVNWNNPGNITLRQDAGPDAALGQAAIRFPNSYAVYLHDTPHKELFDEDQRAFSSGCIRVEKALDLVGLLLADTPGWDKAALARALDEGKTRNVSLARTIPILLAYWTVDIADDHLAFKPDIYKRDAQLLQALDNA
jgi:murein L,D-transpeptidase YcbB/YkuD